MHRMVAWNGVCNRKKVDQIFNAAGGKVTFSADFAVHDSSGEAVLPDLNLLYVSCIFIVKEGGKKFFCVAE